MPSPTAQLARRLPAILALFWGAAAGCGAGSTAAPVDATVDTPVDMEDVSVEVHGDVPASGDVDGDTERMAADVSVSPDGVSVGLDVGDGGDSAPDAGPSVDTGGGVGDAGEPRPSEVAIADNAAWLPVPLDLDPFVSTGDEEPDACPASALKAETTPQGVWFDVSTEGCSWTTVSQPLPVDLPAGATLRVTVVHWLIDAGDTDYTVSLALGDSAEVVWSVEVPLESEFDTLTGEVTTAQAHLAGSPVWFHVGNHGENSWSLTEVVYLPGVSPGVSD